MKSIKFKMCLCSIVFIIIACQSDETRLDQMNQEEIYGHARSTVSFPSLGIWKIEVYIGGEYLNEITVDINNEY